ncbi:hypothetical protein BSNK01_12380 [Bacillaceae bacterium]
MTEQEYFKLLERLVKGADYLDNPLLLPEEYEKGRKLYDEIEEKILRYKGLIP